LLAPRATSDAVIQRVHRAFRAALEDPGLRARLTETGVDPIGSSPATLSAHLKAEVDRWARVVQQAKITRE
jgi:tripartite-type tricarboxylate transporter receptor subunit TctC